MIYQGKARYPVKEVCLHCAAIKTGQFAGKTSIEVWRAIDRWHKERGWKGFGYHGLFMPDGYFRFGRPLTDIGAGVQGHNAGVIHLLLIESKKIDHLGVFESYFTDFQETALKSFIRSLPGIEKVTGHNDYAPKLCPGFTVKSERWLNRKDKQC